MIFKVIKMINFKKNISRRDKMIRFFLSLVLLALGHGGEIYWLNFLALLLLTSGYFEFCFLYALLKRRQPAENSKNAAKTK